MADHAAMPAMRRRRGRLAAVASVGVAALLGSVLYAVPANAGTPGLSAGTLVAAAEDDAPAAAVFAQVPAAQVRNNYDQSLYTPPTGGESTTYTIYQVHVDTSVTPNVTWYDQLLSTSDPTEPFSLNDGLELDLTTGHITAGAADLPQTDSEPEPYVMVINNGVGGADTASDGTLYNESPTRFTELPVALHDVFSGPFSIPVLFNDVPLDNPLSEPIYALADLGVMVGYADGSFQPTRALTRQILARILITVLGHGAYGAGPHPCTVSGLGFLGLASPFNDVAWTNPFCMDIMALSALGVTQGYPDGGFHPTASITRQTMAAMLFRLYAVAVFNNVTGDAACTTPIPFNDVEANNLFCGDIEWLSTHGVSEGYTDGSYRPTLTTSRQAGAGLLYRFFKQFAGQLYVENPLPGMGVTGAQISKAVASAEAAGAAD